MISSPAMKQYIQKFQVPVHSYTGIGHHMAVLYYTEHNIKQKGLGDFQLIESFRRC